MAVYMELSQGDTLVIGGSRIRLERKSGQRARLWIESTDDIERVKAGEPMPSHPPRQAQTSITKPKPAPAVAGMPFLKRPEPATK